MRPPCSSERSPHPSSEAVSSAFGQTAGSGPSFDAAEIHLRARTSNVPFTGASGGVLRGGRYDLRNVTMVDLVAVAYGISDPDLIVGGPNWLERDRFDISAKAAAATTPDTVKLMLQSLLADRFKLVLHKDTRPTPGFVLTVAKGGHKMKEAVGAGNGCQGQGQPQPNGLPMLVGTCKGMSMELFTQQLRGIAGPYLNSPVTDQTGLKGYWDFDIRFTPFAVLGRAGSDGISLQTALERQLGLSLERKQVPTLVTIVDSVNQKPTDNPSGVSASIPSPPPMEFDVAEIKLSQPDAQTRTRLLPGGRIEADGVTMKMIMQLAWDKPYGLERRSGA